MSVNKKWYGIVCMCITMIGFFRPEVDTISRHWRMQECEQYITKYHRWGGRSSKAYVHPSVHLVNLKNPFTFILDDFFFTLLTVSSEQLVLVGVSTDVPGYSRDCVERDVERA